MLHSFTRNYSDLCTDAGYQFEFHCDCCGNGFKSSFIRSSTYGKNKKTETFGRAASTLGSLFGGKLGDLGWAAERGSDLLRGKTESYGPEWRKEQESAFDAAQAEVAPHFKKCPACNRWVCADCWNDDEGLCTECAPRESAYVAQARNRAMRNNIDEAAENAKVWHGKLETRTTVCPSCGKPAGDGKFCHHCGASLEKRTCPQCGAEVPQGLKFCGQCGTKLETENICPECGKKNPPGMKFCGECGTKL